jgi:tripartite-type tricarboxylate transporter receptor subunit TctC
MRRTVMKAISVVAALSAVLLLTPAVAQTNYPDKPTRIMVGFTPGSATDVTARLFAQKFAEAWNVPVTVENLPGGGGSVALERVAKAVPDGATLYWGCKASRPTTRYATWRRSRASS